MDEVFYVFLGFAILMLILALITKFFPAKKANFIYGYRTDRSMRSKKNWDYAQSLLPPMFFRIAAYYFLLALFWFFYPSLSEKTGMIIFLVALVASFSFEVIRNERKLKRFSREKI